jgi:flagellin-like protein
VGPISSNELSPAEKPSRRAVWKVSRRRSRFRRSRRGVSDVVATILLLALTVTLFASIFAFVTSFPAPPAQNSNQFQATLIYNSGSTSIIGLNIVHLAGPQVSTSAQIYLKSAGHPCVSGCPFVGSVPVSLGISTPYWNLGQTWTALFTNFPQSPGYAGDPVPDNVTVSIVTDANLIFSVILPGQAISVPATITATWTTPGSPAAGSAYQVFATVAGTLGTNPVYLTGVPGEVAGAQTMTYSPTAGNWQYSIAAGSTSSIAPGTYTGFVSATSANGATATAPVVVVITASSGGGGSSPLSVAVVLSSSPPSVGATETVQAIVTYTGSVMNAAVTVKFWANTTSMTNKWTGVGPAGTTISGPSTLSVLSQTAWPIAGPQSYVVTASVTVAGVGSVQGTFVFSLTPAITVVCTTSCSSGSVNPGGTVTISGTSFTMSSTVVIYFKDGSSNSTVTCTSGSLSTSGTGTFSCVYTVSGSAGAHTATVSVEDTATAIWKTATIPVT